MFFLLIRTQSKAPYSAEALEARHTQKYAYALRRLIKRRDAIASVSPYLVAAVAVAEEWLYENGVLCYLRGRQLRILDLHGSGDHETVVDTRKLVLEAVEDSRARHKYKMKLLYYSHGIVSCSYTMLRSDQPGYRHWLLVFDSRHGEIITVHPLESVSKLFVRNTDRFLYYGTASCADHDSSGQWVIYGFDLTTRTLLNDRLAYPAAIGTDVNSTVCFDIFDGFFYGLSNQRSLDVEDVDWLSFYTCFRFPLAPRGVEDVEEPPGQPLGRRDHTEGPLDDRFTFLRMFKDETTGQLMAVESRKEWLSGSISGRRTYYTTPISFDMPDGGPKKRRALGETDVLISAAKTLQGAVVRPRTRDPHMVHPGDDSSSFTVTLSKCPVRSYYSSCQAFIDLVDDSNSFDPAHQRLRIRGGTRRLWTPGERSARGCLSAEPRPEEEHSGILRQIDDLYKTERDLFWPPEQDPSIDDPALTDLYAVLNPPGYFGNRRGRWDERSLLYAAQATSGGLKSLVFVSWDPSIFLAGTAPYPSSSALGGQPKPAAKGLPPRAQDRADGSVGMIESRPTLQPNTTLGCGGGLTPKAPLGGGRGIGANASPWRTLEPAAYRDIARGFHFAR